MSELKLKLYLKIFIYHFKNELGLFLAFVLRVILNCYNKIVSVVNYLFLKILNSNKRKIILIFVKLLCFQMLFYSAVLITEDYLSFPFKYKLIVSDITNGFELPPIRICTERQMFFDKNKINQYFNLSEQYQDFQQYVSQQFQGKNFGKFNKVVDWFDNRIERQLFIDRIKNYYLSQFYKTFIKPKISRLKFNELIDLLIKSNQLINISKECHSCGQNKVNEQNFDVFQSIYGNQFGMCFTITQNNKEYTKKDEQVNLNIAFETQNKFAFDANIDLHSIQDGDVYTPDYFFLYYSIFDKNRQIFEKIGTNLRIRRTGMRARFRFSKTTVKMLSTPYMQECDKHGKFNNFKIYLI